MKTIYNRVRIKKVSNFSAVICVIGLFTFVISCKDSNEVTQDSFDRGAMLQHFANDLIIPAYTSLQSSTTTLQTAVNTFTETPSEENLIVAQNAWISTYTTWQYANEYNFGPAGAEGLKKTLVEEIGTFPVSEAKINANIANGSTTMTDANRDARGFLAIEYLLFTADNGTNVTAFGDTNRKSYLQALITHVSGKVNDVVTAWSTYITTFVSLDATDVGSSSSLLYNEFVRSYEVLKNFKVALPAGLQAGQTQSEPKLVEAYYSGTSLTMLKTNFTALENIWYGKSKDGTDGIGFKEYLQSVSGGPALITSTEIQLQAVHDAFDKVPVTPSLSAQIEANSVEIINLSTELQKLTHYIKGDMSSLIGLAITFSSNDGD